MSNGAAAGDDVVLTNCFHLAGDFRFSVQLLRLSLIGLLLFKLAAIFRSFFFIIIFLYLLFSVEMRLERESWRREEVSIAFVQMLMMGKMIGSNFGVVIISANYCYCFYC